MPTCRPNNTCIWALGLAALLQHVNKQAHWVIHELWHTYCVDIFYLVNQFLATTGQCTLRINHTSISMCKQIVSKVKIYCILWQYSFFTCRIRLKRWELQPGTYGVNVRVLPLIHFLYAMLSCNPCKGSFMNVGWQLRKCTEMFHVMYVLCLLLDSEYIVQEVICTAHKHLSCTFHGTPFLTFYPSFPTLSSQAKNVFHSVVYYRPVVIICMWVMYSFYQWDYA